MLHVVFSIIGMPQIKPPQITNHDKFPETRGEDCDSLLVIRGE